MATDKSLPNLDRIVKIERDNAILTTLNGQLKKTVNDQKAGNTHLQEKLTAVLALNKTQAATILNSSIMLSGNTQRIFTTNIQCTEIINAHFKNYESIRELETLKESNASLDVMTIMAKLEPLLTQWSHSETFEQFLPGCVVMPTTRQNRPIPYINNVQEHLTADKRNMPQMASLVWKNSHSLWNTRNSFRFLRDNSVHKSALHAYVSIVATMMLWQLNSKERASYLPGTPVIVDYSDAKSMEVMKECARDILFEDEPVRIRDIGLPGMHQTIDLTEKPDMNNDRNKRRCFK